MESSEPKKKLVKQTFTSEIISVFWHLIAGFVLLLLILPFKSFRLLIIMIPALLTLRGNIGGPFNVRTSRDLIVGEFNKNSFLQNFGAMLMLSVIAALLIGIITIILNVLLIKLQLISITVLIALPIISVLLTSCFTTPISILLNYYSFHRGINPNNIVAPIMTAVGDFFSIICFYIALILLEVP